MTKRHQRVTPASLQRINNLRRARRKKKKVNLDILPGDPHPGHSSRPSLHSDGHVGPITDRVARRLLAADFAALERRVLNDLIAHDMIEMRDGAMTTCYGHMPPNKRGECFADFWKSHGKKIEMPSRTLAERIFEAGWRARKQLDYEIAWGVKRDEAWAPTAENINALPESIRRYIHHVQTSADPAGTLTENFQLRAENRMLRAECSNLSRVEVERALVERIDKSPRERDRLLISLPDWNSLSGLGYVRPYYSEGPVTMAESTWQWLKTQIEKHHAET